MGSPRGGAFVEQGSVLGMMGVGGRLAHFVFKCHLRANGLGTA